MPRYSKRSKKRLASCDERLQEVFNLGIAKSLGLNIRWGGDWDMDFQVMDNRFDDFPHFEIRDK